VQTNGGRGLPQGVIEERTPQSLGGVLDEPADAGELGLLDVHERQAGDRSDADAGPGDLCDRPGEQHLVLRLPCGSADGDHRQRVIEDA
jgi:hypothetical protein